MEFVEVIKRWAESDATKTELEQLQLIVSNVLSIGNTELIQRAIDISNNEHGLAAIKYIKDKTGWGLRQAKDFYDLHVVPNTKNKELI